MSAQELHSLALQFVDAFNKKDLVTAVNMLSDDLEVFDHVPFRFDNKEQFAQFLGGAVEGLLVHVRVPWAQSRKGLMAGL